MRVLFRFAGRIPHETLILSLVIQFGIADIQTLPTEGNMHVRWQDLGTILEKETVSKSQTDRPTKLSNERTFILK
jgi:hypothetical protein